MVKTRGQSLRSTTKKKIKKKQKKKAVSKRSKLVKNPKMACPPSENSGNLISQNEWFAQNTLIHIFQYLDAPDLLKASRVCKIWNRIASDQSLWRSVNLTECRLQWAPMGKHLGRMKTKHLSLIDCIFMLNTDHLIRGLQMILTLTKIELSECSSIFVERLPEAAANLEEINLNLIGGFGVQLDLEFLSKLPLLYKVSLSCNRELASLLPLLYLKKTLKYLALTDVQNLPALELDILSMLKKLEHLTLGNCWNLPQYFPDTILNLQSVKNLTFQGCRECYLNELVKAASQLRTLEELNLLGINVDRGFCAAIARCTNIKKLTIVPNARRVKSADGNTQIVDGVFNLRNNLTSFTLGFSDFYLRHIARVDEVSDCVPFVIDKATYPNSIVPDLFEPKIEQEKYEAPVLLGQVHTFLKKMFPGVKISVLEWKPKWPYSYSNMKNFDPI